MTFARQRRQVGDRREPSRLRAYTVDSPIVVSLVVTVIFLALWMLVVEREVFSALLLPGPDAIFGRFLEMLDRPYQGETVIGHALASLRVALTGWFFAGLIGVPIGVIVGWSRTARQIVMPVFYLLRPIPPIAWIPFAIIWLGFGATARSYIVWLSAFFPFVLNSVAAVVSVDKIQYDAAKNLGASTFQTMRRVVLPGSLPILLAGARIALGNAWMTLVAAELLGATTGLGFVALNARRSLDSETMFVAMGVLGILGGVLSLGSAWIERKLTPWAVGFELEQTS